MTQQLTNMRIRQVSLVDKGANQRTFALLKRDEEAPMPGEATAEALAKGLDEALDRQPSLIRKLIDALSARLQPVPIAKTATFAEVVAGQELRDALYDSWYTLEDVIWGAIYATDENYVDLSLEAKKALIAQDLDEFKAYLLAQMDSGITKRADPADRAQRHIAAIVEKAGRKISGDRLGRLQTAAEALNGVLEEVVELTDEAADDGQEEPVDKTELVSAITEAVTKANEPLVERISELEKAAAAAKVAKGDGEVEDPVTLEGLAAAFEAFVDRVEKGEPAHGARTSADGQESGEPVKKRGVFAGVM